LIAVSPLSSAGGVTTVFDFPVTDRPTTTTAALMQNKIHSAENRLWVDVGLVGLLTAGQVQEQVNNCRSTEVAPLMVRVLGVRWLSSKPLA
jgi:dihydroorotase-like cyclic amidohydrolase